jgi:hypothetical protein
MKRFIDPDVYTSVCVGCGQCIELGALYCTCCELAHALKDAQRPQCCDLTGRYFTMSDAGGDVKLEPAA